MIHWREPRVAGSGFAVLKAAFLHPIEKSGNDRFWCSRSLFLRENLCRNPHCLVYWRAKFAATALGVRNEKPL